MTEVRVKSVLDGGRVRYDVVDNHGKAFTKFDVIYSAFSKRQLEDYLRIKGLDNLLKS